MSTNPIILSTWSFGRIANRAGWEVLLSGGSAIDAVEAACRIVEDDPAVDSVGLGGLPDASGVVTLDGCIMTSPANCGSVCGLTHCPYAVTIARLIMEHTHHIMLAGEGADRFAREVIGEPPVALLTDSAKAVWEQWLSAPHEFTGERYRGWIPPRNVEERDGVGDYSDRISDTVGVIAMDARGDLAGACSTSGMAFKIPGRVGDSPIIGHGLYVEPGVGAVVATGNGELISAVCGAFVAFEHLRLGEEPAEAARIMIDRVADAFDPLHPDHQVAVVVLRADGEWADAALRPGYRTAVQTLEIENELIHTLQVRLPEEGSDEVSAGWL